jgi:hypothetical protein
MSKNKKFWKQLDRYFAIIEDEIRQPDPDFVAIDFYLWKIKRRVEILKRYLNEKAN